MDPIFIVDPDFNYIDVNRRAVELFGFTREEFLTMNILDVIPEEQLPRSREEFRKLTAEGSYEKFVGKMRTKDGRWIDIEVSSSVIFKNGEIIGSRDIVRDITDRVSIMDELRRAGQELEAGVKDRTSQLREANEQLEMEIAKQGKADRELRASEEKYRSLVESTDDSIYLVDRDYRYLFMNKKHGARLGVSRDEVLGQEYGKYHSAEETEWFVKSVGKVFETGKSFYEEHRSPRDGRHFLLTLSPVKAEDESIEAVTVNSKEITERKLMEEELRALSLTDELTGLYNRRGFYTLAKQELKTARRLKGGTYLLFADFDNLKRINDTLGHEEGDVALIETANILRDCFRESDIIGRIGGDEFAVLMLADTDADLEKVSARLRNTLISHNALRDDRYKISLSAGIVHHDPESTRTLEELLVQADKLMFVQKKKKQKS
jgi:diguanylate cyclase (GGDEF)-like protein/PAS domain S-box-containing protein